MFVQNMSKDKQSDISIQLNYSSNDLKQYANKAKSLANTIETKIYVDL